MARLIFICLALIVCCKSQKSNSKIDDDLVLILEDAYFPVDETFSLVINDEKSLTDLFAKINKTRKPGLKMPKIDFNRSTLLFFAAGAQKGTDKVKLNKKSETEGTVVMSIEKVKDKSSNEIVSYPFCLYELPKKDKQIILDF